VRRGQRRRAGCHDRPLGAGGTANAPLTATFQSIQDQIFTPVCTVCHAGGAAPQGLRLDAANSYGLLVGDASSEVPSVLRISLGQPDNSYLVQKLEGHAAIGARMPLGGPYLDATVIAVIRQWIAAGALRTAAAAPPWRVASKDNEVKPTRGLPCGPDRGRSAQRSRPCLLAAHLAFKPADRAVQRLDWHLG
jgi:hypothetical protein